MRVFSKSLRGWTGSLGLLLLTVAAVARPAPPHLPTHLAAARALVEDLQGAQENVYGGGARHIDWTAGHYAARTVCSSFMTLLLEHVYRWKNSDVKAWMSSTNPEAEDYHDAIAARRGFLRIVHVTALRPGDILAIKYTDHHVSSNGVEDTGHVMLVDEAPTLDTSAVPAQLGLTPYLVTVIDSSATGHGQTDTRYRAGTGLTGGIGRGTIRIFANGDGKIAGYTWSASVKSPFYTAPDRDIVAGRLTKTP